MSIDGEDVLNNNISTIIRIRQNKVVGKIVIHRDIQIFLLRSICIILFRLTISILTIFKKYRTITFRKFLLRKMDVFCHPNH